MFGRSRQVYEYSADVRGVLAASRELSARFFSDTVGSAHFLLALFDNPRSTKIFTALGVNPRRAYQVAFRKVVVGRTLSSDAARPYSAEAKQVIEATLAEAREYSDNRITLKCLLVGMIETPASPAGQALRELGLTTDVIRDEVKQKDRSSPAQFRIQIDDTANASIFDQIVGQVTEAVAVGALLPGERLPAVRELADQLDIAPGTVARAYTELAERGVVVTGGAQGTFIADTGGSRLSAAERARMLTEILRPVVVSGFHFGASSAELRNALEDAMRDIFPG